MNADEAAPADPQAQARFFLPDGYRVRMNPAYFADTVEERSGTVHQPDVYRYAAALGDRMGATWLIDIGCGRAGKLLPLGRRFRLFGIDYGENIRWCRSQQKEATWLEWDLTSPEPLPIPEHVARDAVVICSDVIEHLPDPVPLVRNLVGLAERARAVVVSTPTVRSRGAHRTWAPPATCRMCGNGRCQSSHGCSALTVRSRHWRDSPATTITIHRSTRAS